MRYRTPAYRSREEKVIDAVLLSVGVGFGFGVVLLMVALVVLVTT